jgi:hypothetical protein
MWKWECGSVVEHCQEMKTKELGWKENRGIQNMWIEDSKRNIIVGRGQVLRIWENYITELYDQSNWPENEEVNPEEEVDADEKRPYILQSEGKNYQGDKG